VGVVSDVWFERMYELYDTSPVHELFGMKLEALAPGEATVLFTPRPELINASGVVHGGILATIVDSAILQAVRTLIGPDDRPTTLELKLNYVAPGIGESFRCVGKVVRVGGTVGVANAQLVNDAGEPVVAALGTIFIKRARRA
jgi:uncharacterized protein (TIGR00369 family)